MAMSLLTPEQEEAMFQMFLESQACTEALINQRRFEEGNFTINLVKAESETGGGDASFQEELSRFGASLHAGGLPFSQMALALDAVDAHGFPLPEFIIAMKVLGPPAITAIAGYAVAWVQGRNGRKIRIRIGEIEAEGRTIEEITQLLEKAASFQDRHKPSMTPQIDEERK